MIAVTTASAAWTEAAAIAAVAAPLYLIWLIHFVRTQARIPSGRTGQSSAVDIPPVGGNSFRRGTSSGEMDAALPDVLNDIGDEFDAVEFEWLCR